MSGDPSAPTLGALSPVGRRWLAFILSMAMMASTLVVLSYSALSRFLIEDFGISRSQFGWLITSVTAVAAVLSPALGRIADAFGGRAMLLMIFLGSAAALLGIALAWTFPVLLAVSLLCGVLHAAGNPGTNKLIVSYIPPGERGVIMGVKQAGVPIGTFLVGILLPGLSVALGWRRAIALSALVPALAAALVIPLKKDTADAGSENTAYRDPPGIRRLALYAFLMGSGVSSTVAFLPLYAQERIGYEVTDAGFQMALIGLFGIGSRIFWSRRAETLGRFAPTLRTIAALSVVAIALILFAEHLHPRLLWLAALLCGGTVVAWNGVANLAAVALVEPRYAGHASGRVILGFLGGFALSPVLFGYSVELTGSYDRGWGGILLIFAVAAAVMHAWDRAERSRPDN